MQENNSFFHKNVNVFELTAPCRGGIHTSQMDLWLNRERQKKNPASTHACKTICIDTCTAPWGSIPAFFQHKSQCYSERKQLWQRRWQEGFCAENGFSSPGSFAILGGRCQAQSGLLKVSSETKFCECANQRARLLTAYPGEISRVGLNVHPFLWKEYQPKQLKATRAATRSFQFVYNTYKVGVWSIKAFTSTMSESSLIFPCRPCLPCRKKVA